MLVETDIPTMLELSSLDDFDVNKFDETFSIPAYFSFASIM